MGATSVDGTGPGISTRPTITKIQTLMNAPAIYAAGYIEAVEDDIPTSPPSTGNEIEFDPPFEGPSSRYVVMLTTLNGGYAYVYDMDEDVDGNFNSFSFISESAGTVMYMVVKVGTRE